MRSPAHISFGLLCGSIAASFYANSPDVNFGVNSLTLACLGATVSGAIFPDIDNQHAPIAKALPFLSKPIRRRWPHRTGMHSVLGMLLSVLGFWAILRLVSASSVHLGMAVDLRPGMLAILFAVSFCSHLCLDCTTKAGTRFLYPLIHNPFGYPSLEQFRFRSGDLRPEVVICALSFMAFAGYTHATWQGTNLAVSNVVGQYEQLRGVYLNAVNKEVIVRFDGYWAADKSPVSGLALILEDRGDVFAVAFNGRVHYLGENAGNLRMMSGTVQLLDRLPQVRAASFYNATVADILANMAIGQTGQIFVSGLLESNRTFTVRQPFDQMALSVTAKSLSLDYARPEDVRNLNIRPANTGPTVLELELKIEQTKVREDSLVAGRQQSSDLYERNRLFEQIKTMRQEMKTLEKELVKKAESDSNGIDVRFSGQLNIREVPGF